VSNSEVYMQIYIYLCICIYIMYITYPCMLQLIKCNVGMVYTDISSSLKPSYKHQQGDIAVYHKLIPTDNSFKGSSRAQRMEVQFKKFQELFFHY
jgi:hypothetical protein